MDARCGAVVRRQLKPREIDRLDLNLSLDFTRACQRVMAMTILAFGFIRVKTSSFNVVQMVSRCRSETGALTAFDRVVDQDPVGSNRRNAGVGLADRIESSAHIFLSAQLRSAGSVSISSEKSAGRRGRVRIYGLDRRLAAHMGTDPSSIRLALKGVKVSLECRPQTGGSDDHTHCYQLSFSWHRHVVAPMVHGVGSSNGRLPE